MGREGHGLDVAARAIVTIRVIDPERIARLRELFDSHAVLHLIEDPMAPQNVVQPRADPAPRIFEDAPAGRSRGGDVVVEKAIELGVGVFAEYSGGRAQVEG